VLTRPIPSSEVGSRAAFEGFYRREYRRVYQLAWLLTRSNELAEDVTQEAFLGTYRAFDRLKTPEAYVRTAVVNQTRMAVRRRFGREKRAALLRAPAATDLAVSELTDILCRRP
jgi:DNA-directed RNA polymerase specialized sigma24 family protein